MSVKQGINDPSLMEYINFLTYINLLRNLDQQL